jgi:20S proteasome subunit alpha 5
VGLQTKEGTVLAVEKRLSSPLLDPGSVEKIAEVDIHIGAAMSGLVADARTLVDHARVEAQNHRFTYDEPIGVEALTQGTNTIDELWFERTTVPRYRLCARAF